MSLREHVGKDWLRMLAYLLLAAVAALAIWRVERIADEAHDTAIAFKVAQDSENTEEQQEATIICQTRNTASRNSRQGDGRIIDAFEQAFLRGADTPEDVAEVQARAQEAREHVLEGRSAEVEDSDCDGDGELTEAGDYFP